MTAPPADLLAALALADELGPAVTRVTRRLRREAHTAGLSPADAQLLAIVGRSPGLGVSDLADQEHVARPSMSARIKRLEAAGLIVRSCDRDDGRRSGFTLTRAGQRRIETVRRLRSDWLAARLAALTPLERERLAAAVSPLRRLVEPEA